MKKENLVIPTATDEAQKRVPPGNSDPQALLTAKGTGLHKETVILGSRQEMYEISPE